jgi:hypothetical protein
VRVIIGNRAYVGEMTVPTERKGAVEVIKDAHPRMVTDDQWERANAAGGEYIPRNGRWASQARLSGLVYCSGCGKRLAPSGGGKGNKRVPYYACHAEGCTQRVGIRMEGLDQHVADELSAAFLRMEPHIVRIMEGDDRYQRALEAVEAARVELDTFIETVKVTDIGKDAWIRGKEARQASLDLSRKELRVVPSPKRRGLTAITGPEDDCAHLARFIDHVVVKPVGRGRRVPVGERVDVFFIGAEHQAAAPPAPNAETLAALAAGVHEEVAA